MTNREMLQAYRDAVLEMQELHIRLMQILKDGKPRGTQSIQLDSLGGTNHAEAAVMQAADGIEEMIGRKRSELAELAAPVGMLMAAIGSSRTYMVIQQYYLQAATDADIARSMQMSRGRVNQIRNEYLAQVC